MRVNYSIKQINDLVHGTLKGDPSVLIESIVTDTRNYISTDHPIFIALQGYKNNGHQYIEDAYNKGIMNFIVTQTPTIKLKKANFIIVDNTLNALQKWATYHRSRFNIPVIGITGSNGKTIIKEWLYHFLRKHYNIIRSPKSYNSQLGVPLSLLMINKDHDLAIIEVGISEPGEMLKLKTMIQPTHTLLTNLGSAHSDHFSSIEDLHKEKLILLEGTQAFGPAPYFQKINYFKNENNVIQVNRLERNDHAQIMSFTWGHKKYKAEIPLKDHATAHNLSACFNLLLNWKVPIKEILELSKDLPSVALRLEKRKGIDNSIIIDDSYNSDLLSIKMALDHLSNESENLKKVVILSDVLQDKTASSKIYSDISQWIKDHRVDHFIGIGSKIYNQKKLFPSGSFFKDTSSFLNKIHLFSFKDSAVLLKGSRKFSFQKIARILEKKSHETILTINVKILYNNYLYYRKITPKKTKLLCMIKAAGYGTGIIEIAKKLTTANPDYFGVAYTDEGVELRENNIQIPILVMNPEPNSFDDIIQHHLTPSIYSLEQLDQFIRKLIDHEEKQYPIHLKFDTGMHRLGFNYSDIHSVYDLISNQPEIRVEGVFSHLASSDNKKDDDFTTEQLNKFEKITSKMEQLLGYPVIKHILNTSGIERFNKRSFDMVRLGLGLYGISEFSKKAITPIATLTSSISQIKWIKKGGSVGYGRGQIVEKDTKIGVIPIGYADGYSRMLSNGKGKMFINGETVSTIGKVCMDMTMLDLTETNSKIGDQVEIFGPNHAIQELASEMQTIPYEILSSVSERVIRIYIEE